MEACLIYASRSDWPRVPRSSTQHQASRQTATSCTTIPFLSSKVQLHCWTCSREALVHHWYPFPSSIGIISGWPQPSRGYWSTTCQSSCPNSLQTSSTWKHTTSPKPADPHLPQWMVWTAQGQRRIATLLASQNRPLHMWRPILYDTRIVVPKELQQQSLCKIHHGYQGIERCRLRVSTSVWWPGVSSQMATFVHQCSTCARLLPPTKESMLPSALPKHPWEKGASNLFEFKWKQYFLVVNNYSRYLQVIQLTATTSFSVISSMKNIFSRHGIPHTMVSDNGSQYNSAEM